MFFRHSADGTITINSRKIELELFLEIEPEYALPEGVVAQEYIPNVHHLHYTGSDQRPGPMPWPDGDRYIRREVELLMVQKDQEKEKRLIESTPEKTTQEPKDPNEYTTHELVMTMWEHLFGDIDITDKAKELSKKIKKWRTK
jgi:hypothetical protein